MEGKVGDKKDETWLGYFDVVITGEVAILLEGQGMRDREFSWEKKIYIYKQKNKHKKKIKNKKLFL